MYGPFDWPLGFTEATSNSGRAPQYCVVTCALGFESKASPRYPHERMEPVERTHHARHSVGQAVAAPNVLQLMDHRAPPIRVVPRLRVAREDNGGMKDAARH